MSSTKKTTNLKLNQWISSDIPERLDFVSDNDLIDKAVSSHTKNNSIHVSDADRDKWTNSYYKFSYVGDGASPKTILTDCPFDASWGLIFANSYPPSVMDAENNSNYNYFAVFTNSANTSGASITGSNSIKVYQSSTAVQRTEYRNFNQTGVVYTCILFR